MRRTSFPFLFSAVVLLLSAGSTAQQPPAPPGGDRPDGARQGVVRDGRVAAYVRGLDADGNGKIELEEQGGLSGIIKRIAEADRSLDPSRPIAVDRLAEAFDRYSRRRSNHHFFTATNGFPNEYSLLLRKEVQGELKLTDKQKELLEEVHRYTRDMMNPGFAKRRELMEKMRSASREERLRLRAELRGGFSPIAPPVVMREVATENAKRSAAALTDAQNTRLAQIWIQSLGQLALTEHAEVVARLKLTEEQLQKLRAANGRATYGVWLAQSAKGKAGLAQALEVLTDEQRKQFDELRGKPFQFPELREPPAWLRQPPGPSAPRLLDLMVNGLPDKISLLLRYSVQAELEFSRRQQEELDKIRDEIAARRAESAAEFLEKLSAASSDEQRRRLAAGQIRAIREQAETNGKRVVALLTDAQKKRFSQLWLQVQGTAALLDPEVVETLKLSEQQQGRIRGFGMGFGRSRGTLPNEMRERQLSSALRDLTDEQRARFDELRGKEFALPTRSNSVSFDRGSGLPNEYQLLANDEKVQAEVALTDAQQAVLKAIGRDFAEQYDRDEETGREVEGIRRWAPDEDRRRVMIPPVSIHLDLLDFRSQRALENRERLAAVLTAAQKKRLAELWFQHQDERVFDFVRGLDADGNGKIEPKEQGRLSAFIERLAETEPSIDPSQPIPIDRLNEAMERYRQQRLGGNPPNQRDNPAQAQRAEGKPRGPTPLLAPHPRRISPSWTSPRRTRRSPTKASSFEAMPRNSSRNTIKAATARCRRTSGSR